MRSTALDNAPDGREVHWSSSVVWLLAGTAHVRSWFTGDFSISRASYFAGPVLGLICLALLWVIVAKGVGRVYASFFVLIFGVSPLIADCFVVGETDHHGLVCALAAGSVLALGFGSARSSPAPWFVASGVLGGAALWVSAASFIPVLIGCAAGAFFCIPGKTLEPRLWRLWGFAGCVASLFFYALEYFPHQMGWRLEVNHPLYALAWLGAGDLLARAATWVRTQKTPNIWPDACYVLASLAALALPLVMIVWRSDLVFWVSDNFLFGLHNAYISEFQSFARSVQSFVVWRIVWEIFAWPIFALTAGLYLLLKDLMAPRWKASFLVSLPPAAVLLILAMVQIRWLNLAIALWLACSLFAVVGYVAKVGRPSRMAILWFALAFVPSVAIFPFARLASAPSSGELAKEWTQTILLRDIAHRLVQSSPRSLPIVLSGPTSSTDLTYYAGLKTVGTLYWENLKGLRMAGAMFAAPDDATLHALIIQTGVTHIVVASWDDFGRGYTRLLSADPEHPTDGFLAQIVDGTQTTPPWLERLEYPIPPAFGIDGEWVAIFRVKALDLF